MKFNELISSCATEKLQLDSIADYFESLSSKCTQIIDYLTSASSGDYGDSLASMNLPDVDGLNVIYDDKLNLTTSAHEVSVHSLLEAIVTDSDYVLAYDGFKTTVRNLIDQITASYNANIAIVMSVKALASSGASSAADVLSDFKSRIELKLGGLTQGACDYGYAFIDILQSAGMTIKEKVRSLLQYIGIWDASSDVTTIGFPICEFSDVSGVNVVQAFVNELPDNLAELWQWMKDTLSTIFGMVITLAETFIGSSVWRSITKYVHTMSGAADSFNFTNYAEDVDCFDDVCQTFDLPRVTIAYGSDTIAGQYAITAYIILGRISSTGESISTILHSMDSYLGDFSDVVGALTSNASLLTGVAAAMDIVKTYGSSVVPIGARKGNIYQDLMTLNDWLSRQLNVLLTTDKVYEKLSATSYLHFDMPCSSLYAWASAGHIYVKRYVSPLICSLNQFITACRLTRSSDGYGGCLLSSNSVSGDELQNMILFVNSCRSRYASTDDDIYTGLIYANYIDSMYLNYLDHVYDNTGFGNVNLHTSYSVSNVSVIGVKDSEGTILGLWGPVEFHSLLLSNDHGFVSYPDSITGVTVAKLITGSDDLKNALILVSKSTTFSTTFLMPLLYLTTAPDGGYIPFTRTTALPTGRYNVMTTSGLAHVFSKTIEVVAIVASVLLGLKLIGKIKRKAYVMSATADSKLWNAAGEDKLNADQVKSLYKMHKKANILDSIASSITGLTSNILSSAIGTVKTAVTSTASAIRNAVSGSDNSVEGGTSNHTINEIKNLIVKD